MSWRHPLPAACWEAGNVSTVIPVEAETPSDGVFQATHSPLPILQREKVDVHVGEVVDEHTVLEAVRRQPADYPVLPILGRSGTGKSHLVRWLRMNLDLKDSTRLVFVPKHRTSLRGIIELVLQHAAGEGAAALRARVREAVEGIADEHEARLRLRTELATLVETRGALPGMHAGEEAQDRSYLASELPALLLDPYFRKTILGDGSAVARLVREKLYGKAAEDKEEGFGFSPDDVRLSVDDVQHASRAAQDIASVLASDDELPRLAARMLNEQLGQAVSAVFGLGGDDLKELLVELRLDLARSDEDLLLLIEDFSIFQGIQGGLIDAITLIPSQKLPVCPMRAVMAVTTGYFVNQLPDTVKTRTYVAFDMDLTSSVQRRPDPAVFAAPYLNAVRVGQASLDAAHAADHEVPNACGTCPVVARCHDAFGEVEGFGLFPFNREALERAVSSKAGPEGNFIARDVLNRVLRPVLHRDRDAVVNGEFPTDAFARDFAAGAEGLLDIEDEARLERVEDPPSTNNRRKRLVRFWGSGAGAQNLSPVLHEAFDIPQIPGLRQGRRRTKAGSSTGTSPGAGTGSGTGTGSVTSAKPALVQAVDRWIETGELGQRERNDLRKIIHNLIIERLELEDGLWSPGRWTDPTKLAPAFPQTAIHLGTTPRSGQTKQVALHLEGGSADARAVRGWAWYSAVGSWRRVDNGEQLQRLAYAKLGEWVRRVEDELLPPRDGNPSEELVAVTYALDLGAQILGVSGAHGSDLGDRVRALIDPAQPREQAEAWPNLESLFGAARSGGGVSAAADREALRTRFLRLVSFSQGGMPLGLDIPRVAQALKQADRPPELADELSEDVVRHLGILSARLSELDGLGEQMRVMLPDLAAIGSDIREVTAVVDDLLDRVRAAGLLPGSVVPETVRQAGRAVKDGDVAAVARAQERLDGWSDLEQRGKLRLLTGAWYAPAVRVRGWIESAHAALERLEDHLASDGAGHLGTELQRAAVSLQDAMDSAITSITRLLADDDEVVA
jgi:hypothetical protein